MNNIQLPTPKIWLFPLTKLLSWHVMLRPNIVHYFQYMISLWNWQVKTTLYEWIFELSQICIMFKYPTLILGHITIGRKRDQRRLYNSYQRYFSYYSIWYHWGLENSKIYFYLWKHNGHSPFLWSWKIIYL